MGVLSLFSITDWISFLGIVVTVIIAIIGGIYGIVSSTKKYELTEEYKRELLEWYKHVVETMILIIHLVSNDCWNGDQFLERKIELLSDLSALAERGRFYFPNIIQNDDYGINKLPAYQGHRNSVIDFIIQFYDECSKEKISLKKLQQLERSYNSAIYVVIDPVKRNMQYRRHLEITIPKGQTRDDYKKENGKYM